MRKAIYLEDLQKYPIRLNHYDKENGNEHFVLGVESVLEYAENLPAAVGGPIIHCEDCKFWHRIQKTKNGWCSSDGCIGSVTETDFCSKARKKEENYE